jgi:hypothetical protein
MAAADMCRSKPRPPSSARPPPATPTSLILNDVDTASGPTLAALSPATMSKFKVRSRPRAPAGLPHPADVSLVLLQAMKEDPPPDAKCRDKFLVQSVLVTADKEFANVATLVRGTM